MEAVRICTGEDRWSESEASSPSVAQRARYHRRLLCQGAQPIAPAARRLERGVGIDSFGREGRETRPILSSCPVLHYTILRL